VGHEVYTPTLTGLGERVHLASPEIDLTTHIQDVVNVLEYEDLQEVVLVGHSYGGMVIAGVADRTAPRIAHLVYLDAFVPRDGEGVFDHFGDRGAASQEGARARGDGWRLPPPAEEALITMAGTADLPWLTRHLTSQPLKTFQEPIHFATPTLSGIPATYIRCTDHPLPIFGESVLRAKSAGWPFRELATGHDAMVTMPRELADLFLAVV
jgi:pimeloyl-ACP methyl ester carboxylesterase